MYDFKKLHSQKLQFQELQFQEPWKIRIAGALSALLKEAGIGESVGPEAVIAEIPPPLKWATSGSPCIVTTAHSLFIPKTAG